MKSFVDLLFILLCSTIVMLSQSLQVGSMDIAPATMGSGSLSEVRADDVVLVAVYEGVCKIVAEDGQKQQFSNIRQLQDIIPPGKCLLLSAANEDVSHHRIMNVFSWCVDIGYAVKLAAVPRKQIMSELETS